MTKYCVAQVDVRQGVAVVTYYACTDDAYGLHRVNDITNSAVIWHDTVEEAKKMRLNYNDCVIPYIK